MISIPASTKAVEIYPPFAITDTPSEIFAMFPNAIEVKLLKGGAVNQCFRVKTATEIFAFRLGVEDPHKYGFNRDEELTFYTEAEFLKIAPPLKAFNPAKGILVMKYIDGTLVDEQSIRSTDVLPKVINLMQSLHKIKNSKSGEGKTIEHLRFFMDKLKEHQALPAEWEEFINRSIAEMPKTSKLVLCHNDLAFNLLEDKVGRVWAIDFECAGWNNPAFDLAFLCIWYEFTDEEKQLLLNSYTNRTISMRELNSAIRLGLLFSALWSLLEVIYGKESYRNQAQELFQKALTLKT